MALVPWGTLDLKKSSCAANFSPIDPDCTCRTCRDHTQASLHLLAVPKETVACSLITIHNLHYQVLYSTTPSLENDLFDCIFVPQLTLMRDLRQSILENRFVEFVREMMRQQYPTGDYDQWVVDALESVNISLRTPPQSPHNSHTDTQ